MSPSQITRSLQLARCTALAQRAVLPESRQTPQVAATSLEVVTQYKKKTKNLGTVPLSAETILLLSEMSGAFYNDVQ